LIRLVAGSGLVWWDGRPLKKGFFLVKFGINTNAALAEARSLGASINLLPGVNCWQVTFPGRRPIRIHKTEKVAPRQLVKAINGATPADPARSPVKRAKHHASKSVNRSCASRPPAAIRHRVDRSRKFWFRVSPEVHHKQGEIVRARIFAAGKQRFETVVIVEDHPGQHSVIGLTGLSTYGSGEPRLPIPNFAACGFDRQVFIYAPRLIFVAHFDDQVHQGWADPALMNLISQII
jgi:hypothetical protein